MFAIDTRTSDTLAWERQDGEPTKAHHGFTHYRGQGAERSVTKAWREHQVQCLRRPGREVDGKRAVRRWETWASQWGWMDRVTAYDAALDRQVRTKARQAQIEARERHVRLAQGTLTALSFPVRAMLESLADPTTVERLTARVRSGPEGTLAVLALAIRAAQVIPALVMIERLALGLTTNHIEMETRDERPLGLRIAEDGEATALAVALLDRLAQLTPDHAQ